MLCHRLIARLDIKGPNLVKGIHLEGLRVMGKPAEFAKRYAEEGADELLYTDVVASLYGRSQLTSLLEETTREVFIPITVAGGVRSAGDVQRLLRAGADKVALNTAALARPSLVKELAEHFGSQCIVVSIEARRHNGGYECCTDNGRCPTGRDAQAWADEAVALGAGEILITSIEREGTRKGFDLELAKLLAPLPVPVVACGGMGKIEHLQQLFDAGITAAAFASVLHYGIHTFQEIKNGLEGHPIRQLTQSDLSYWQSEAGRNEARSESRLPEES